MRTIYPSSGILSRKTVFITGSARRLGRSLALAMAEEGCTLLLHAHRSKKELRDLACTLRKGGAEVYTYYGDLGKESGLKRIIEDLKNTPGPPDLMILNAASFLRKPLHQTTLKEWDEVLRLNLRAPVVLAIELGMMMKRKGWGRIVIIGDSLGLVPYPLYAVHSIAKSALLPAVRILAEELAPEVTVNLVAPGAVLLPEDYTQAQIQRAIERSLLKTLGSPEDVIEAVRFFFKNKYITGAILPVDGGRSLKG
jgi:NAD(P)-dependent dehydrogenase (short-subunit alcohol dehydrogenase family)